MTEENNNEIEVEIFSLTKKVKTIINIFRKPLNIGYAIVAFGFLLPLFASICFFISGLFYGKIYWMDLGAILSYIPMFSIIEGIGLTVIFFSVKLRTKVIILTCVALFFAGGYTSNELSYKNCEEETATWLYNDQMNGQAFYVLESRSTPYMLSVFDKIGANYTVYPEDQMNNGNLDFFPWAEFEKPETSIPFLVSVPFGRVWQPQGGGGRNYFTFFGLIISLGNSTTWLT